MELLYDKTLKYVNILSRIQKRTSIEEGYFIIIRLYLTNNTFYYFLCILFRFASLLIISQLMSSKVSGPYSIIL